MSAIISLAEGCISPDLDEETAWALGRIPYLVERISSLIKTALSYGRARPPNLEWHQLGMLIKQSISLLFSPNEELPSGLLPSQSLMSIPVYVDQEQIVSVLTNLLQNAFQEAGIERVQLQIHKSPPLMGEAYYYCRKPVVALDVIDFGRGIPESIQQDIFKPFFTTKNNGTGLGLAFARDLARRNNCEVVLLKSSEKGSVFRIYFPTYEKEKGK